MPALVLGCGHSFHASCIKRMLTLRWPKARITFGFMGCPLCKVPVDHPSLEALTTPASTQARSPAPRDVPLHA